MQMHQQYDIKTKDLHEIRIIFSRGFDTLSSNLYRNKQS